MTLSAELGKIKERLALTDEGLAESFHTDLAVLDSWKSGKAFPDAHATSLILAFIGTCGLQPESIGSFKDALLNSSNAEVLLDDSNEAVVIADIESKKILFINTLAAHLAGKENSDCIGRPCYKIMWHNDHPCDGCFLNDIPSDVFRERKVIPHGADAASTTKQRLIDWNGKKACISGLIDRTATINQLMRISNERGQMLNLMPGGIFRYRADSPGLFDFISDNMCKMLGYTKAEFIKKFDNCFENMIWHEDRERVIKEIEAQVSASDHDFCEYRIEKKDGSLCWVHDMGSLILGEDGTRWFYVTIVDITENKLAKQQYESLDFRYQLLNAALPGGMMGLYIEEGLPIYFVNRRMLDYLGYETEEEFNSKNNGRLINCIVAEDRERVMQEISHQMKESFGEQYETEYRMFREDGSVIWIHDVARRQHADTDRVSVMCVGYDITARQDLLMIKSRDREMLYQATKEISPLCIAVNLTRNTYYMIEYGKAANHTAPDKGIFDDLLEIGISTVPEEDKKPFEQAFSRKNLLAAYENGSKKIELEHRQYDDDGVLHWLHTTVIFIPDPNGIDILEVTMTRSVDERKENEEKLRMALESANDASAAKSRFLSSMSHEIRTPMNAIIGMTKLAKDAIDDKKSVSRYIGEIDSSSQYLLGIINDILEMSRIESGKFELHKQWISPNDIVQDCITMIRPMMNEKNITFIYPEPGYFPSNVQILADPMRTKQMLMNLLNNAYKFTQVGGKVSITIDNAPEKDRHGVCNIVVKDNGCGMSEEFMRRIFVPFEREYNPSTKEIQGTGLGLSLAREFALAMGGDITVESELGKGSAFAITCPYEYRLVDYTEGHVSDQAFAAGKIMGKRILLVEDNPLNREIAAKILENKGFVVDSAENGKEGVEKFAAASQGYYDAILMDVRMPVMDGLNAARTIRALKRADAADVPILAMTANAFEEDIKQTMEAGMNAHLSKPIEPDKLYETLYKYLVRD